MVRRFLAGLAAVAFVAVSAAGATPTRTGIYEITAEAKLRYNWSAGAAAPECLRGVRGFVGVTLATPRGVRVRVTDAGGSFSVLSPVGGKLKPIPLAGYITASGPTRPGCSKPSDVNGCAQRGTPPGARLVFTQGKKLFVLVAKGVRYVPVRGTCFLGDWTDFHEFPGGDFNFPVVRTPISLLSKTRFQLQGNLNVKGKLTSFDGTTTATLTITVFFRKINA
ncbi:MAG: hypothetical protein ACRDNB_02295 [Gaiellaceae bacterium]